MIKIPATVNRGTKAALTTFAHNRERKADTNPNRRPAAPNDLVQLPPAAKTTGAFAHRFTA